MKNIALFFGTFNPVHNAHMAIAFGVYDTKQFSEVWFVPAKESPNKVGQDIPSFEIRVHLLQEAIGSFGSIFKVCEIENTLESPTRTIDTMGALKEKYNDVNFTIILGMDNINDIHNWKDSERLVAENPILVVKREGIEDVALVDYQTLELPIPSSISGSKIREMVKNKQTIIPFVPREVYVAIKTFNLYE